MITTVVFDLDDTLYDEIEYIKSGFTAVAEFLAEPPENPEVTIHSGKESQQESLQKILRTLELMNYIPPDPASTQIPADEEAKIKERLAELGYL